MSKYKVLTDHWKANLFEGDIIPGDMYSGAVLERATGSGYIEPYESGFEGAYDGPTMNNTKKEIEQYLDANGIEYDEYATKSELLDLIK